MSEYGQLEFLRANDREKFQTTTNLKKKISTAIGQYRARVINCQVTTPQKSATRISAINASIKVSPSLASTNLTGSIRPE